MPLAGKMLYIYTSCNLAVICKWTCSDTGLQTGIPDSFQNFDIQTDRYHDKNWHNRNAILNQNLHIML